MGDAGDFLKDVVDTGFKAVDDIFKGTARGIEQIRRETSGEAGDVDRATENRAKKKVKDAADKKEREFKEGVAQKEADEEAISSRTANVKSQRSGRKSGRSGTILTGSLGLEDGGKSTGKTLLGL